MRASPPTPRRNLPLLIHGMGGLGDGIYTRPFVKAHAARYPVLLSTPWPQLYTDVPNVQFIRPWAMRLRTQRKNVLRKNAAQWVGVPRYTSKVSVHYRLAKPGQTILQELEERIGPKGVHVHLDLPVFGPSPVQADRPVAVIRPVSIRREWPNAARNPHASYVARSAELLHEAGYYVVAVADIHPKEEPAVLPLPVADESFIHGELPVEQLMALLQGAEVIVGGIGWIVPAALALPRPAVFINGGQGLHNAPELVTDPRLDCSRVRFIVPDQFCRCGDMRHQCQKTISDFDARFVRALAEATLAPVEVAA